MYYILKFEEFENFKPNFVLTIKYVSKSEETFKLSLNIAIILSSNKILVITSTTICKLFC